MRAGAREHLAWPCAPDESAGDGAAIVEPKAGGGRAPAFAAAADPRCRRADHRRQRREGRDRQNDAGRQSGRRAGDRNRRADGSAGPVHAVRRRRPAAEPVAAPDAGRLDAAGPADMDERLLEDHLERHECGLRVLAGAAAPLPLDALSPECLDRILGLLKRGHRYIVLDVPPVLHATTLLCPVPCRRSCCWSPTCLI